MKGLRVALVALPLRSAPLTREMNALSSGCRESRKKSERIQGEGFSGSADSLETFLERLRDRCQDNGGCHGPDRAGRIQEQARCARALAVELGILKQSPYRWEEFRDSSTAVWMGSEHLVEFSPQSSRYAKTTIPPAFGLTPAVISLRVANLRADPNRPSSRQAIEFVLAAPLEYLERWQSSNDIFGDDVRLASVIEWPDGAVSFGITQPQYHGIPAEPRDIERRVGGENLANAGSGGGQIGEIAIVGDRADDGEAIGINGFVAEIEYGHGLSP